MGQGLAGLSPLGALTAAAEGAGVVTGRVGDIRLARRAIRPIWARMKGPASVMGDKSSSQGTSEQLRAAIETATFPNELF